MMNTTIKGIHMPLTDAITSAVTTKIAGLEKLIHEDAYIEVELGRPSQHHKSGEDIYMTEINIDMKGQHYFVQVTHQDLYSAIDKAVADMTEVIKQGKGKRQTLTRKGRMLIKKLLKQGFS